MPVETITTLSGRKRRVVELPDLVEALRLALIEEDDPDAWDPLRIHASDLGYSTSAIPDPRDRKCARELWLRLNGMDEKEPTPGIRLMWRQGKHLEEQMVMLWNVGLRLMKSGWEVAYTQFRIDDSFPGELTGALDIEMYGPNGEKVIVDVKTVRGRAFEYLTQPKMQAVRQVQTYMMAEDADLGLLFYVDREGQNFAKQFPVPRDDEAILQAYEDVLDIKAQHQMPPTISPDYHAPRETKTKGYSVTAKMPWQCDYCPFYGGACKGALPADQADKVVGHVSLEGEFQAREGFEEVAEKIGELLEGRGELELIRLNHEGEELGAA